MGDLKSLDETGMTLVTFMLREYCNGFILWHALEALSAPGVSKVE